MKVSKNQKWDEIASPRLSVVMIGHRSELLLSRALASLLRHSPSGGWELILVSNGDNPEIRDFAAELLRAERMPLCVANVAECRPGAARNAGVRQARSPLLFFLDDDIECFQDILSPALKLFENPEIQAAGGANLTPPGSNALARATGGLMASRMGAGAMSQRYRLGPEEATTEHGLILCNLAVRRSVFESERGFASQMISNEENVLLQRLSSRGATLWRSPHLAIFHHRRERWSGLLSQSAKYGAGRAQNLLLMPETFRIFYLLPSLFFLYLATLPILLFLFGGIILAPLASYLVLSLAQSIALAVSEFDFAPLLGPFLLPAIHCSYGWGFLCSFWVWSRRQHQLAEHLA